jgi:hypothetical protein
MSMHDVFVSYAHADNEIAEGSSAKFGWVTTLAQNLNRGPNVYKKDLFIDHRLKPGDDFSEDLIEKVANSRLLLILLSQNYIDSKWCGKELDHFIRTHAKDPDKPTDVFVVELFPYETFERVPVNIQNLRKRLIHAKFWCQPADASSPVLAGNPTPEESGLAREYWRARNELQVAMDSRLRAMRSAQSVTAAEERTANATPTLRRASGSLGTVLLADVTEDLETQRNQIRAALEPEGVAVVPQGDYVGLAPQEFETAIAGDLGQSILFVQLLSPTPGRKGKGFDAPLPQLQFQHAASAKLPILQWCEQLPQPGQLVDPAHAKLFETEFVRATNLPAFQMEVIDWLKAKRDKDQVRPQPPPTGKKLIFIDDIAGAPSLNQKLLALVRAANCDIRSLPPSAPLGGNGIDIVETLRHCRAGITIYADRAKLATVYNRVVFFLNQIAEASLPVARWAVYSEQVSVPGELGIVSDDVVTIGEQGLTQFLRGL